jgi:Obg family GTPase CgtA
LVDRVRVYVRGGGGGQGSQKNGRNGGNGGNVVVVAHAQTGSLAAIARRERRRFIAESGQNATFKKRRVNDGNNEIIRVPVGTMVYNEDGSLIGDLNVDGSNVTVAVGGEGGSAMTDNYSGVKGDKKIIILELKTIADVGLVGFPNAGKSTLLRALSNAEPKVADYPFTTERPQIGVLCYPQLDFRLTLADIPGLVEGASENKGMGHRFLRHIERTKILLFVVDVNGFQLAANCPFRSAVETVGILEEEIKLYSEELACRPRILAINKLDSDGAEKHFAHLTTVVEERNNDAGKFHNLVGISALKQQGLSDLEESLRQCYLDDIS